MLTVTNMATWSVPPVQSLTDKHVHKHQRLWKPQFAFSTVTMSVDTCIQILPPGSNMCHGLLVLWAPLVFLDDSMIDIHMSPAICHSGKIWRFCQLGLTESLIYPLRLRVSSFLSDLGTVNVITLPVQSVLMTPCRSFPLIRIPSYKYHCCIFPSGSVLRSQRQLVIWGSLLLYNPHLQHHVT
jgi:hypothetical protein